MAKILILGGTGAIGAHLVKVLAYGDHKVFVTSRVERNSFANIHYLPGNAKNNTFLDSLLQERYDCIIDFMHWSTDEFRKIYKSFLNSTGHYIFLSSYRVYANSDMTPLTEESPLLLDTVKDKNYLKTDEYALAKARCGRLLKESGFRNFTIVRPSITFSTRRYQICTLEANLIIPRSFQGKPLILAREMMDKRAAVGWGGSAGRMIAALITQELAKGNIYNLGTSESHTWKTIAAYYHELLGTDYILVDVKQYLKLGFAYYQSMYDRMFNRIINNDKIVDFLAKVNTKFAIPSIKDSLEYEIRQFNRMKLHIGENATISAKMDKFIEDNVDTLNLVYGDQFKLLSVVEKNRTSLGSSKVDKNKQPKHESSEVRSLLKSSGAAIRSILEAHAKSAGKYGNAGQIDLPRGESEYTQDSISFVSNPKKRLAIVLATDSNMVFACGTFILNILEVMPNFDKIIIFCAGLSQDEERGLLVLDSRVELLKYSLEEFAKEFQIDIQQFTSTACCRRYTFLTAAKVKIFTLLDTYKHVVYFDSDMLLNEPLDELLDIPQYNIGWSPCVSIKDKIILGGFNFDTLPDDEFLLEYSNIACCNGGFLVLKDNFDYRSAYEIGRIFAKVAISLHPILIDETSLGYIAKKLNLKILDVSKYSYNIKPGGLSVHTKLAHFVNQKLKPWNSQIVQTIYHDWLTRYKKFVKITSIKSNMVTEYPYVCSVIGSTEAIRMWDKLFENSVFPQQLYVTLDYSKMYLYLHHDNLFFFRLGTNWQFRLVYCRIYIDKAITTVAKNFLQRWDEFISHSPDGVFEQNEYYYIFKFPGINQEHFPRQFQLIYASTEELRACSALTPPLYLAVRGKLRTFFGTYISYDGERLSQADDPRDVIDVLVSGDIIYFKITGMDSYVRRISAIGLVDLSRSPRCFGIRWKGNKIAVTALNKHLSARNDRSVKLVAQCRDWEYFDFISD